MPIISFIILGMLTVSCIVIVIVLTKYRNAVDTLYSAKDEVEMLTQSLSRKRGELETVVAQLAQRTVDVNEILKEATVYETKFHELSKKFGEEVITNEALKVEVIRWKDEAGKSLSQRKSSEVRVGKIAENFAPLEKTFPYPIDTAVFSGQPIDFVCYDIDAENPGIHFVEIKSGNADLSAKQRKIRDLIKEGKVTFEVFRINPTE